MEARSVEHAGRPHCTIVDCCYIITSLLQHCEIIYLIHQHITLLSVLKR